MPGILPQDMMHWILMNRGWFDKISAKNLPEFVTVASVQVMENCNFDKVQQHLAGPMWSSPSNRIGRKLLLVVVMAVVSVLLFCQPWYAQGISRAGQAPRRLDSGAAHSAARRHGPHCARPPSGRLRVSGPPPPDAGRRPELQDHGGPLFLQCKVYSIGQDCIVCSLLLFGRNYSPPLLKA